MEIEFHSLCWDNVSPDMINAHKRVMKHFEIPVTYHNTNTDHGKWMDAIFRKTAADIMVILEPDCIPLYKNAVPDAISYAAGNNTFIGIAQVSNHIRPTSHVYAAPAFYVMPVSVYNSLGRPSFRRNRKSDIAEKLSYVAEKRGKRYRALFPTHFEREPYGGIWPLGPLGYYGIGTVFNNSIYHLYHSRMAENIELFIKRCDEVINGNFTTNGFYSSTVFDYKGNIAL